jgi:hypothetical protein
VVALVVAVAARLELQQVAPVLSVKDLLVVTGPVDILVQVAAAQVQ